MSSFFEDDILQVVKTSKEMCSSYALMQSQTFFLELELEGKKACCVSICVSWGVGRRTNG